MQSVTCPQELSLWFSRKATELVSLFLSLFFNFLGDSNVRPELRLPLIDGGSEISTQLSGFHAHTVLTSYCLFSLLLCWADVRSFCFVLFLF